MKIARWCVMFGLLAAVAVGAYIYVDLNTPVPTAAGKMLAVTRGEPFEQILNDLLRQGIVSHRWPLKIYARLAQRALRVQAGNYQFDTAITPLAVFDRLERPGQYDRLTVIEGWTRFDIAEVLAHTAQFHLKNKASALKLLDDVALIGDLDQHATNLEGYLFPDTYFFVADTTAPEMVSHMVQRFRQVWNDSLKDAAQRQHRSAHDVVVIASIVETEAKLKEERPIVASVIENRLRLGMPLSMDSTLVYAAKVAGAWKNDGKVYQSDIDRVSPYNTRRNRGLPPGPVGSPGLSSLQAAVAPAGTNYIYYVRNPDRNDGAHNFYCDEKGFDKGVQALRAWEQRRKKA